MLPKYLGRRQTEYVDDLQRAAEQQEGHARRRQAMPRQHDGGGRRVDDDGDQAEGRHERQRIRAALGQHVYFGR